VFYSAPADRVGDSVRVVLELDGGAPIESEARLSAASVAGDLATTANVPIPGDRIGAVLSYRVSIVEEADSDDGGDNPNARHPERGLETHVVDAEQNTLRVTLVPFAYHHDGSGRLPDLSPERVEAYRNRFLQLYPVSEVEITVHEPVDWYERIAGDGTGWQNVGVTLFTMRTREAAPNDVYYYGMFNPADSLSAFCGGSCLLGVTLLNNDPPETGSAGLRLALGVGFDEVALDTSAHEIGHSHGREHAPCGGPEGVDPRYPHDGAKLGVWGYDIVGGDLVDPEAFTDIMGYCDNQWVSDYTFKALLTRGVNVNLPRLGEAPSLPARSYQLVTVDGQGRAQFQVAVPYRASTGGLSLPVLVTTQRGMAAQLEGRFFRYDHLPGGWLLFPQIDGAVRAEAILDGAPIVARR
jgi:hypothetical protein